MKWLVVFRSYSLSHLLVVFLAILVVITSKRVSHVNDLGHTSGLNFQMKVGEWRSRSLQGQIYKTLGTRISRMA